MDIKDLMVHAAHILDLTDNGWERDIYFDLSKLTEECGEVAECLNKSAKTKKDLEDELADVITVISIIALKKDIDLQKALEVKQKKQVKKLIERFHSGKRTDPTKRVSL